MALRAVASRDRDAVWTGRAHEHHSLQRSFARPGLRVGEEAAQRWALLQRGTQQYQRPRARLTSIALRVCHEAKQHG